MPTVSPTTSSLITLTNNAEAVSVSIAYDPAFYQRVAAITTTVAYAICREQDGGNIVTGHTFRASRALQWLGNASLQASQIAMALAVTAANTINESSTSQQIADELARIWDTLSGN